MKSFYLFASSLLIGSGTLLAQIPNPSFENWGDPDPVGWTTSNAAAPSVLQSGDAHAGVSAARLESFSASQLVFGGTLISEEFLQTTTEQALRGWYKASFQGGDNLSIGAFINNTMDEPVQTGNGTLTGSTSVYTQFSVDMVTVGAGSPGTAVISLIIYGPGGSFIGATLGTNVLVDDLSWGASVGIEEVVAAGTKFESVYPNPTNGNPALVQFNLAQSSEVVLEVFDITGKKVLGLLNQKMSPGHYRAEMNTESLTAGVYFCRMIVNGSVQTIRFVN